MLVLGPAGRVPQLERPVAGRRRAFAARERHVTLPRVCRLVRQRQPPVLPGLQDGAPKQRQ